MRRYSKSGKISITNRLIREESWALRQRAIQFTAFGLWVLAPVLKNPLFEREKECRLIVTDLERVEVAYGEGLSKEMQICHSNNRDIPYKVLQYDTLPIVGLDLGPLATAEEDAPVLRQLLRQATSGYEVPITRSRVPVGHETG